MSTDTNPRGPSSASSSATARLAGRTAIVTGGGSGIGQAIALLFARHGARVAILDVAAAADTAHQITSEGGSALPLDCDVTSQAQVVEAFRQVADQWGALDILVNCAGVAHVGTVETTTEQDIDRVYSVN